MRTLHRHQYELRAAILSNVEAAINGAITVTGLAPAEQVDIYRNHYRFTLIDALKATFPVVEKLVGDKFFAAMALRFVTRHPPTGPVLFEYGHSLGDFIEDCKWMSEALPYLPDVARLEWALNAAYHAEDALPIALSALAELPPDQVGRNSLAVHPSVSLIRSRFPIDAIWRANQPEAAPDTLVDLDQGEARIVVYRRELDVEWRALSLAEDVFLEALATGVDLETAHGAARGIGDFDLPSTLAWTFTAGLFVGVASRSALPNPLSKRSFAP